MQDLTLFWQLADGSLDDPTLALRLKSAGGLSLERRLALFAVIERALVAEDPALRAAAVSVLSGADGRLALGAEIRLLSDVDAGVAQAAVEALRQSVIRCHARFAHALFHPSLATRRAALSVEPPAGAASLVPYLLADPECRDLLEPAKLTVDHHALPLMLALTDSGELGLNDAARLIAALDPRDVLEIIARGRERSQLEIEHVLQQGSPEGSDAFDDLFRLLLVADVDLLDGFLHALGLALVAEGSELRRRAAAALRTLPLGDAGLRLLGLSHPLALGFAEFPRAARQKAALALYQPGKLEQLDPECVGALLRELVPRDGGLDLRVAGALLRLVHEQPFRLLFEMFPKSDVIDAFVADPLHSASLLAIADDSKRGRKHVMDLLLARGVLERGQLDALLAWVLPTNGLGFIELLEPQAALAMAQALLDLGSAPGVTFGPRKIDRLAVLLATRLTEGWREQLVRRWLTKFVARLVAFPEPSSSSFGLTLLGEWSRKISAPTFVEALLALGSERLKKALPCVVAASRVGFGKELALATELREHSDAELRDWAEQRLGGGSTSALGVPTASGVVELDPGRVREIVRSSPPDFEALLTTLHGVAHRGLAPALARRPAISSVPVCVALLGTHDEPEQVALQFERFREADETFMTAVDERAVAVWSAHSELPLLGASWLWRWEKQSARVGALLEAATGGPVAALQAAVTLPSPLLAMHVWRAAAECWTLWGARDRQRLIAFDERYGNDLTELCIRQLGGELEVGAAEILRALHRIGSPAIVKNLAGIEARLPDTGDDARARLERIVSSRGLSPRAAGRLKKRTLESFERERIRSLSDPEQLARLCAEADVAIVEEAALRLIDLGLEGVGRIADLLTGDPLPIAFVALVETIPLWPEGPALERMRALLDSEGAAELRFRLALAFVERGSDEALETALEAAVQPGRVGWLGDSDVEYLARRAPERELWRRLARSAHPHAYRRAVEGLIAIKDDEPEDRLAVRDFLAAGTERLHELRQLAALWLANRKDPFGYPLLLESTLSDGKMLLYPSLSDRHVAWAVTAALYAGATSEAKLLAALDARHVPQRHLEPAWERLLLDASSLHTLRSVAQYASRRAARRGKLAAIAETFAWGARMAPVLTGKRLRAHLTEDRALGHTRLDSARIYVSALPLLRGDRHGDEIVEGLILHELGHHRYHADKVGLSVWKQAEKERLFGLLNLVADEHLERNLRALDSGFGDRLKRLAAWAFQHSDRDLPVSFLTRVLGARTFAVLSKTELSLAFNSDSVRVDSAALLLEMERVGLSFVRFVRALRMGLGDRHDDPLVRRALTLFGKDFKKNPMPRLLEIAHELKALFGWEAALAEQYGGHESGPGSERDDVIHGDGIGDDEVQQEVERVIDPERRKLGGKAGSGPGRPWINVSGNPHFDPIHNVQPMTRDPAEHQLLAQEVRRHARRLRNVLEELGLARQPFHGRIQGTRLDRARLPAMVIRGEPRVLIRRERVIHCDLFLGVAVDCSGSMQSGQNIDKARRFAVLLAEAARGLSGVDLRVFGFTDTVLYDAGDAERCAASSLTAGGGNNDAAALFHVASLAKKSRRTSRLLVMVSDGLPTECSTEALRGLVDRLERREHMCVAQVAVRPLSEQCFRHYVLLEEDDLDGSVRRFGQTVGRLVRRAISV